MLYCQVLNHKRENISIQDVSGRKMKRLIVFRMLTINLKIQNILSNYRTLF